MEKHFVMHDVSDFPIVRVSMSARLPDAAHIWLEEMDALLKQEKPFAFIYLDTPDGNAEKGEEPESMKSAGKWYKANKRALAAICKGFISIEPDLAVRLAKRARAAFIGKAMGFHLAVVRDLQEAELLARKLIAEG